MADVVVLLGALLVILLGAELFTNGIEWFGHKLGLAEGAVGSVLAAVGTALPETMIPLIAILITGGAAANEGGGGAIRGAPVLLSTLAMFVTGIAVIWVAQRRPRGDEMLGDSAVLIHDVRAFVLAYALAAVAPLLQASLLGRRCVVPAARPRLATLGRRGPAHREVRLVREGPSAGRAVDRVRGSGAAPA